MPTDPAMLNEAISAAQAGDKARARDLLSRLLKIDKDVPEHWLWMSAVVETRQEQIYCLQNLLRLDPKNVVARRGLVMMGAMEPDPLAVTPVPPARNRPWTVTELEIERPRGWRAILANPALRIIVTLLAGILALSLLGAGVVGFRSWLPATPTPNFAATAAAVGQVITLTPSPTTTPSPTPKFIPATPTPAQPMPLAALLEATYTPTPLYVNTPHPLTEAFRLGLRAMDRRDWEAVIDFMQQTISLDPQAADAFFYMGEAQLELGDAPAALEAFNQAIQLDDVFGPAYVGRARARLALNPAADVLADLDEAVSLSNDYGLAYLERARYLIATGQVEEAADDLLAAETLLPGSPQVAYLNALRSYELGTFADALVHAALAHEADITDLATYRLLGQINLALDDPLTAAGWLETYLLFAPEDLEGLRLLAQAYASAGAIVDALDIFDRLIEEDLIDPDVFFSRGMVYLSIGETQAALDDFNQANRLRRNDFTIMLALGRALLANGEPGDAYVQLNDTLPLAVDDGDRALVYYYRGLALVAIIANGDASSIPAAVRDFENALALDESLTEEIVADIEAQLEQLQAPTPSP